MSHDDEYTAGPAPIWPRPRVRVATTYREVSYAPDVIEVEIDVDQVSVGDVVAIINAMAFVAYGPIAVPNGGSSTNGADPRQMSLLE
jgi:hypothetical protein